MHNTFMICNYSYIIRDIMPTRSDLPPQIQQIIDTVQFATLSTVCEDGSPWGTPLFVCWDEHLNAYWASWTNNQHSRNVAHCPDAFLTIFNTNVDEDGAKALYMQMTIEELNTPGQISKALRYYQTPIGETGLDDLQPPHPRRIYKATPNKLWTNTWGTHNGHYIDYRKMISV